MFSPLRRYAGTTSRHRESVVHPRGRTEAGAPQQNGPDWLARSAGLYSADSRFDSGVRLQVLFLLCPDHVVATAPGIGLGWRRLDGESPVASSPTTLHRGDNQHHHKEPDPEP